MFVEQTLHEKRFVTLVTLELARHIPQMFFLVVLVKYEARVIDLCTAGLQAKEPAIFFFPFRVQLQFLHFGRLPNALAI